MFDSLDDPKFKGADMLEEILCLTTLVAVGELPVEARVVDAKEYYRKIEDCENCPFNTKCVACEINQ